MFADDTSGTGSEENYDGGLLFSWSMHQVTALFKTLKVMLPKIIEDGSLSRVLDQCMGCSFSKNTSTAVENFRLVSDSHQWVPLPAVGFPTSVVSEENQEDVTPPSYLMEHPPLAVFVNDKSDICFSTTLSAFSNFGYRYTLVTCGG